MRGYKKIGECSVIGCPEICNEDNGFMDEQIRGTIHNSIIGEMEKSGCQNYYVVVYKKVEIHPR